MKIDSNSQYYNTNFSECSITLNTNNVPKCKGVEKSNPNANQEPKTYEVQSGDCLWNIVKNEYGLNNSTEISNKIYEIAKDNNISNINLIYAGSTLVLSGLYEDEKPADINETALKVDEFEKWNSTKNAEKYLQGEQIEDFQMFDFENGDYEEYFSKLKDFSQEYINKYDKDGDKSLSKEEFIELGMSGIDFDKEYVESLGYEYSEETAKMLEDNQKSILSILYKGFNMNDQEGIQADELASQFLVADFYDDPDGRPDGKINFETYNSFASNPIAFDENGKAVVSEDYLYQVYDRKALWEQVF